MCTEDFMHLLGSAETSNHMKMPAISRTGMDFIPLHESMRQSVHPEEDIVIYFDNVSSVILPAHSSEKLQGLVCQACISFLDMQSCLL